MRSLSLFSLPAFCSLALFGIALPLGAQTTPVTADSGQAALFQELGRGINLGNALEAPKEGAWGVTLQDGYFDAIAKAGFTTIRVPMRWSAHAGAAAPYALDPDFLARIDWVVAQAAAHHLHAILDFHGYDELFADPAANAARFVGLWQAVAEHYKDAPPTVLFELCNEPHDKLDAAAWNALIPQALAAIRPSNPDRWIVVGPAQWNSVGGLKDLTLPESDRRLIVTVHDYDPMPFTHQGAGWVPGADKWLGTRWTGTPEEREAMEKGLDEAAAWAELHARPLFLGEFGSYGRTTPMGDRVAWTSSMARAAEALSIPWAYWEFCAGFGAYDPKTDTWRQPLLNALIPPTVQ